MNSQVNDALLKKAVEKASLAEPITRCRIIRDHDSLWWEEYSTTGISDSVLILSSYNPRDLMYQALSFPLDPYNGQLFQVILIESKEGNGDIVVINAHHIVMDGRGLKDFAGLIIRFYLQYQTGNPTDIPVTPISSRQLPKVSTLLSDRGKRSIPHDAPDWCSRASVPVRSLIAENFLYSTLTFNKKRTDILQDTRKQWGITVNDCMMAIIALAIFYVLKEKTETIIPMYITIDLRRYLSKIPDRSLVNFSTSCIVRIPVKPGESLKDTGKRVHILMDHIKNNHPGLDEAMNAEQLSESGYQIAQDLVNTQWNTILEKGSKTTIFSNTGIINCQQVNPGQPPVRHAYLLPSLFQPPGFFFLLSTFEDSMTLSATYATPAYNPELVHRMFTYIDSIIPGFTTYPGEYEVFR